MIESMRRDKALERTQAPPVPPFKRGGEGGWRKRHRLIVSLAAATLSLVLLGAGGGFWLRHQASEQRAEAARQEADQRLAVTAALDTVGELQSHRHWKQAADVLDQAERWLGTDRPEDLGQRVAQARTDLKLMSALDAARLQSAISLTDQFDKAAAAQKYATAFQEAGLGQEGGDVDGTAARIRASAVGTHVVSALDDWADCVGDGPQRQWLLAVARLADPDPWKDRFRDPQVWRERSALEQLAREAEGKSLSPLTLATLAGVLKERGGDAVPLLRAAQARYPDDFWLNFILGEALQSAQRPAESLGYWRAALALRPQTDAIYINLGNDLKATGRLDEAVAAYEMALTLNPKNMSAYLNLGIAFTATGRLDEAVSACDKAIALSPKNAVAHYHLGLALKEAGRLDQAIAAYEKANDLDPKHAIALNHLGIALREKGSLDEAVAVYKKALTIDPKNAKIHVDLGNVLSDQGRLDEAVLAYEEALVLDPKDARIHFNRGHALSAKGRHDEAIVAYEKSLALDPRDAKCFYHLGNSLRAKARWDEAIQAYQTSLALDSKDARANFHLGITLSAKGRLDEAIAAYESTVALDPSHAKAHYNLGYALGQKGRLDEAITIYEKAVRLDPKDFRSAYNLGGLLAARDRLDEAVTAFRTAIERLPDFAEAHCNLGQTLQRQGEYAAALTALKRGHELGSQQKDWRYPSDDWVRRCERLLTLDANLPAIIKGEARPADAAEHLEYARHSHDKKLYATSARLWADAFVADPKLAASMKPGHRYQAACAAALAGCGQGADADQLDEPQRALWRKQALEWLRVDLALRNKELDSSAAAERKISADNLRRWQQDPDLAGLRDLKELVKLPVNEQEACARIWEEVDVLLKKAEGKE